MKKFLVGVGAVLGLALGVIGLIFSGLTVKKLYENPLGSVERSSEYKVFVVTTTMTGIYTPKLGVGALGSVTITSSTNGQISIYDSAMVSSSPTTTIAVFKHGATPGTYTFDTMIYNNLRIEFGVGNNGNFVVTYR